MKFKEFLLVSEAASPVEFDKLIDIKDNKRLFGDYLRLNSKLDEAIKNLALELELSGEEYREITKLSMPEAITSGDHTSENKYRLFSTEKMSAMMHFVSIGFEPFTPSKESKQAVLMRIRGENYVYHSWNIPDSGDDKFFKVTGLRMLNEYKVLSDTFHKVRLNIDSGMSRKSLEDKKLPIFSWMPFI